MIGELGHTSIREAAADSLARKLAGSDPMRGGNRWVWFSIGILLGAVGVIEPIHAAAFQNLDFEDTVVVDLGGDVPTWVVTSVPGWSFSLWNPPGLGYHIAALPQQFLANDLLPAELTWPPLEGHFSAAMATEPDCNGGDCVTPIAPFISQSGDVPAGTRSIRMLATNPRPYVLPGEAQEPTAWFLSLGGVEIPMIEVKPGLFSGDATAFAGSLAELRIGLNADYVAYIHFGSSLSPVYSRGTFDDVEFSPLRFDVVPEGATFSLFTIGMAATSWLWPRSRRQSRC
jgi:hypothetical protein